MDHFQVIVTFLGVKQLIGREFDDPEVLRHVKTSPFNVCEENNQVKICVEYKGKEKTLFPEEVVAALLIKMRDNAEAYLGEEVSDVVITIPAFFNNSQREATMKAAEIAGLNVIRLLNEPTAAAIAYRDKLVNSERSRQHILVYHLGGFI